MFNRSNFKKLAAKLDSLPRETEQFDMGDFFYQTGDEYNPNATREYIEAKEIPCNTCACAAGWGPAAGVPFPDGVEYGYWIEYIRRQFLTSDRGIHVDEHPVYSWCFSDDWAEVDNTPHGAAARIKWMLDGKSIDHPIHPETVDMYQLYNKDRV